MDEKIKKLILANLALTIILMIGGIWLYLNSASQFNFLAEQIGVSKQALEARSILSSLAPAGKSVADVLKPADISAKLGFQGTIVRVDAANKMIGVKGRLEYAYASAEEAAKVGPMPKTEFTKEFLIGKDTKIEKREFAAGKPKPVQILSISDLKENDSISVKVGDVKSLTNEASGPLTAKSITVFSFPALGTPTTK